MSTSATVTHDDRAFPSIPSSHRAHGAHYFPLTPSHSPIFPGIPQSNVNMNKRGLSKPVASPTTRILARPDATDVFQASHLHIRLSPLPSCAAIIDAFALDRVMTRQIPEDLSLVSIRSHLDLKSPSGDNPDNPIIASAR